MKAALWNAVKTWLPDMDLNHDKQIQSLLCYRYTIGQTGLTRLGVGRPESRLQSWKNTTKTAHQNGGPKAKAAEDCRTPRRFASIRRRECPPGFGVRQS